jgi:hypothetical protein
VFGIFGGLTVIDCGVGPNFGFNSVREDSALFAATMETVIDSFGPRERVVFFSAPLAKDVASTLNARELSAVNAKRAAWLRQVGISPTPPAFAACDPVLSGRNRIEGCPTKPTVVVRVSPPARRGQSRVVEVMLLEFNPSGSSWESFRYVFADRRQRWTLVSREGRILP